MNDSLPLLFAVSTMGNRENLNLKRFPKENFLSPKGSLGTRAKEQASIGRIPRYIASVFSVSPPDLSASMLILMLTSLPHISVDNRAGMGRRKTNVPCLCWERL